MAINPYVPAVAVGNGVQVDFTFTFPYIFPTHVVALINGTPTTAFTFLSTNVLRFNTPPANGATVTILRETPGDALAAEIQPGGPLPIVGLNRNFLQSLYYNQETQYSAANQSTAGLQAQIDAITITSNNALASAGAAVTTANAAQATASGLAASIATANTNASDAVTTANAAAAAAAAAAPLLSPTFTGTVTVPNINGGQLAGLRNRIINGDFRVDQRFAGGVQILTAGLTAAMTADRWYAYCTGANVNGQRITVAGTQVDPTRYQFSGAASVTAIGIGQRIEAQNCRDLAGTTATLSVSLSNSLLTTVSWQAFYANTNDAFGTLASPTRTSIASGSFTGVTGTYTRFSTQISIPAAATTGIEIVFTVGAQTSGTWVVGQVQLERGAVATPFEQRSIAVEETLCRRYFQRMRGSLRAHATAANQLVRQTIPLSPPMRAIPSTTIGAAGSRINTSSVTVIASPDVYSTSHEITSSAAGDYYSIDDVITAVAEL
jgi:hypothetical protein